MSWGEKGKAPGPPVSTTHDLAKQTLWWGYCLRNPGSCFSLTGLQLPSMMPRLFSCKAGRPPQKSWRFFVLSNDSRQEKDVLWKTHQDITANWDFLNGSPSESFSVRKKKHKEQGCGILLSLALSPTYLWWLLWDSSLSTLLLSCIKCFSFCSSLFSQLLFAWYHIFYIIDMQLSVFMLVFFSFLTIPLCRKSHFLHNDSSVQSTDIQLSVFLLLFFNFLTVPLCRKSHLHYYRYLIVRCFSSVVQLDLTCHLLHEWEFSLLQK